MGDNMKNKGFTMIELLTVIAILGIVLLITIPVINNVIEDSKQKAFKANVELISKAAESYFVENAFKMPTKVDKPAFLFLDKLVEDGYIKPIKNPNNENENCTGYVLVTMTGTDILSYNPYLKCGNNYETDNYKEYTEENLILYLPSTSSPQLSGGKYYWVDNSNSRKNAELINMGMTSTSGYNNLKMGYTFDGINDYLRIPSDTIYNTSSTGEFTYSMWVTNSDYATRQTILARTNTCNNQGHFEIYFQSNRLYFGYYSNLQPGSVGHYTDAILTNGTSYNIVWVKKWGQLGVKVYLNGELQTIYGDSARQGTTYSDPIFIGARNGDGTTCQSDPFPFRFMNGTIHDILIYNRNLTESEINYNYLFGKARIGL